MRSPPISLSVSSSSLSRPKRQRMMRDSIGVSVRNADTTLAAYADLGAAPWVRS